MIISTSLVKFHHTCDVLSRTFLFYLVFALLTRTQSRLLSPTLHPRCASSTLRVISISRRYVRLLGAFYMRLIGTALDVYQYLEPLYYDFRKIRRRLRDGTYVLTTVDQIIDELLTQDQVFDTVLPRLPKRMALEAADKLAPRKSALENLEADVIVEEPLLLETTSSGALLPDRHTDADVSSGSAARGHSDRDRDRHRHPKAHSPSPRRRSPSPRRRR
jgi:pre-mRNA-splicing factor 38A